MAQWARVFAAIANDDGSVMSTCMVTDNRL